jgi:hypothetical protein
VSGSVDGPKGWVSSFPNGRSRLNCPKFKRNDAGMESCALYLDRDRGAGDVAEYSICVECSVTFRG